MGVSMKKLAITPLVKPDALDAIHKATGGNIRFPVHDGLPTAQGRFNFFPVISCLKDHGARIPAPRSTSRITVTQVKGSNVIIIRRGGTIYLRTRDSFCSHCLAPFLPL
jgi:hypothetical protein